VPSRSSPSTEGAIVNPSSYGPFPYSPIIRRPPFKWPNGARVAFWIVPNIEIFSLNSHPGGLGAGKLPDIPTWAVRDYGNRVGVFRLMDVLDKYGIRGTAALNGDICIHHPEIVEEGCKRQWDWMGHNQTNSRRLNDVPPEEESAIIRDTLETISRSTGKRPTGWLSAGLQETWNSLDILAEAGCDYVADWGSNDDQPYLMSTATKPLVSVPYSYAVNDKQAFEISHQSPSDFQDMICRQFDTLYREGAEIPRVMHLAVHPYLTGLPYRIGALDAALKHICGHDDVWFATGTEIARHFLDHSKTIEAEGLQK
jgi:allantoinase